MRSAPALCAVMATVAIALAVAPVPARAGFAAYCEPQPLLNAAQHDKLLRFGALVKQELDRSGRSIALIARSGLDLSRFGMRYSHAGVSLKQSPDTPWAVRQLYYACDERKPLLYDQGMAAFVLGATDTRGPPAIGYVSIVLLPPAHDADLASAALDKRQALGLLGAHYSANAYPFSQQYQNCNQWVLELLATAWARRPAAAADAVDVDVSADDASDVGVDVDVSATASLPRARAQAWLKNQGYAPAVFDVGLRPLLWLGAFTPWLHADDHPAEDTAQALYRVSMPASIEAFVHATVPQAARVELCHTERQLVVHRGWDPIDEGCRPGAQDTVIALDAGG